jgi:hypothetical protein
MVHGTKVSENKVMDPLALRREFSQLMREAPRRLVPPIDGEDTDQDIFVISMNVASVISVVLIMNRYKTG